MDARYRELTQQFDVAQLLSAITAEDFAEFMSFGLPSSLCNIIQGDQFNQLQTFFQDDNKKNQGKVNTYIDIPHCQMTCLEYAVHYGKWKMAALLLITLDADPKQNCFDGEVQTMASQMGFEGPEVYPEFDGKPIPGFQGLKTLANAFLEDDELEKMLAFLSLVEWLLVKPNKLSQLERPSTKEHIVQAIVNLRHLDPPDCDTIVGNLKDRVKATYLVLRKHANGLEEVVVTNILCQVVQNYLWNVFVDMVENFIIEHEQHE